MRYKNKSTELQEKDCNISENISKIFLKETKAMDCTLNTNSLSHLSIYQK